MPHWVILVVPLVGVAASLLAAILTEASKRGARIEPGTVQAKTGEIAIQLGLATVVLGVPDDRRADAGTC